MNAIFELRARQVNDSFARYRARIIAAKNDFSDRLRQNGDGYEIDPSNIRADEYDAIGQQLKADLGRFLTELGELRDLARKVEKMENADRDRRLKEEDDRAAAMFTEKETA
jgi:hypothetical protein